MCHHTELCSTGLQLLRGADKPTGKVTEEQSMWPPWRAAQKVIWRCWFWNKCSNRGHSHLAGFPGLCTQSCDKYVGSPCAPRPMHWGAQATRVTSSRVLAWEAGSLLMGGASPASRRED